MYAEVFPSRLKEERSKCGLTQEQLADVLRLSNVAISRYENGTRQPDFETLAKLANFFEVTAGYLIGLEAQKINKTAIMNTNEILNDLESDARKQNRNDKKRAVAV